MPSKEPGEGIILIINEGGLAQTMMGGDIPGLFVQVL